MTEIHPVPSPDPTAARDLRRAAALIGHHRRRDAAGLSAILEEVAGPEELCALLVAVLTVHEANLDRCGLHLDLTAVERLALALAGAEGAP